jgi:hypothetical protein
MRRSVPTLLLAFILAASSMTAHGQEADMAHFASLDGLQRVIARAWSAPFPGMEPAAATAATPAAAPAASPVATPAGTSAEITNLSVLVYLFDSDESAAAGYERIDADLANVSETDSRAPMDEKLPLAGVGDQANGFMGELAQGDVTYTFTFGTVLDGPFVYSISGVFAGEGGAELTRDLVSTLVGSPMNRMAEQFDPHGRSRGGIWSMLDGIQPGMPEGSSTLDLIIFPMPDADATPDASPVG